MLLISSKPYVHSFASTQVQPGRGQQLTPSFLPHCPVREGGWPPTWDRRAHRGQESPPEVPGIARSSRAGPGTPASHSFLHNTSHRPGRKMLPRETQHTLPDSATGSRPGASGKSRPGALAQVYRQPVGGGDHLRSSVYSSYQLTLKVTICSSNFSSGKVFTLNSFLF